MKQVKVHFLHQPGCHHQLIIKLLWIMLVVVFFTKAVWQSPVMTLFFFFFCWLPNKNVLCLEKHVTTWSTDRLCTGAECRNDCFFPFLFEMYLKTGFSVSHNDENSHESQRVEESHSNPPIWFTFKATDAHWTNRKTGAFLAEICDELHPVESASHSSSWGVPYRQTKLIIWSNLLGQACWELLFCNITQFLFGDAFSHINVFKDRDRDGHLF